MLAAVLLALPQEPAPPAASSGNLLLRGGADGSLRPDQKLSREHSLLGFTLHAAHAMFAERDLGTIEAGKSADFTVFDRDLRVCPEEEILQAKVLMTVVRGRVAWSAAGR
ncbi:MAG: amidohydrolase family protein [Planctomycetota bacterium]